MTTQLTAHQFKHIYEDLGINLNTLGCVMLTVDPVYSGIRDDWSYYSEDPEKFWVAGVEPAEDPHLTVMYGLLEKAGTWANHIDSLLDGWWGKVTLEPLVVERIEVFPSPMDWEPYSCIVARTNEPGWLTEARQRLSLLPHLNTYSTYKPHVTLAYVHQEFTRVAAEHASHLVGKAFHPSGIDLGSPLK